MEVYAAFKSVPDYSGPGPVLVSLHNSFEGAKTALYPERDYEFRLSTSLSRDKTWYGPGGYGMIRQMEVKP